ncbi:MAG: hypothetical protein RMJ43_06720 [Chloroherpetonaceae bacterium]|nr:hypothetical protein [Chthonomonadaceae bacterium]MDW8207513.1 hypothetical protein [Chloroherpetonaceae bacterium]
MSDEPAWKLEQDTEDPLASPPQVPRVFPPLPPFARCARCGSLYVTPLPYFAAGSGVASRPLADDVYCARCGHIGAAEYM